jgi:hypothetical protein
VVTFTDLAFDGTSIVWRITHHYHAVPESMARPAKHVLAALDGQEVGPVAFVASGGGAVALHSGGVPFGAGPVARVLAQASARLSPPSRLVVITRPGDGRPLAATLLLPWSPDSAMIPVGELVALAAIIGMRTGAGTVDPALIRMAWDCRPAVVTSLLPASASHTTSNPTSNSTGNATADSMSSGSDIDTIHECILGLAAEGLGWPQPKRRPAVASSRRSWRALAHLALGQTQP